MSSWEEIQAVKVKRNSLREKLEKRKKERQDLLGNSSPGGPGAVAGLIKIESATNLSEDKGKLLLTSIKSDQTGSADIDAEVEKCLVQVLADKSLILPSNSAQIAELVEKHVQKAVLRDSIAYYLHKLAGQKLINVKEVSIGGTVGYEVISAEHINLQALHDDMAMNHGPAGPGNRDGHKRKADFSKDLPDGGSKVARGTLAGAKDEGRKGNSVDASLSCKASDILSLLSLPSTREKQSKKVGEEILELLSKPTAKERSLVEKFKSQGGAQVMEFCPHGTRIECMRSSEASPESKEPSDSKKAHETDDEFEKDKETAVPAEDVSNKTDAVGPNEIKLEPESSEAASAEPRLEAEDTKTKYQCNKLHFKKIIQNHTDETLGDCSFLNTCFHMDTCKYVHYEVDTYVDQTPNTVPAKFETPDEHVAGPKRPIADASATLYPPQWIQCDLRFLDMTVLGKFAVVMADPPWDIHMELPYGTMSDDEMRQLGVPALQDDGLIFLWVTGRAMELGRECLKLWGYERVDELIWVKTNQLQRIIRTGRTGHWLNHGKEHCLVGMKGNPPNLNRGLDCDVIVAEVRATSHKPDEIYGIIERLSPGTRKIELFGRPHNVQPNWITLGNQLDGIRLVDPELINSFQKRYPDGNCMTPGKIP
ncbi:AGAP002895-PA [Anopheles gambiae str. PEST]|uniref:mRNA m(6)A methyltransferase n=1 Tax=Anopheles gambiae TaxID=7165 RepID=Q7QD05_ANOGA|nr:N6-adenosine-methyltransferase MT-A70-like protein isoform X1 [Anopheles gambiae]EAA08196.5 AGAP002895-PA [Anopheles gambiae str. PEST]